MRGRVMFLKNLVRRSHALRALLVVVAVAGSMSLGAAPAEAHVGTVGPVAYTRATHNGHGDRCTKIRATGVGRDHGDGTTEATISVHGVVVGTTAATLTVGPVE